MRWASVPSRDARKDIGAPDRREGQSAWQMYMRGRWWLSMEEQHFGGILFSGLLASVVALIRGMGAARGNSSYFLRSTGVEIA